MKKGLYIVIDGLDGSGKGTIFDILKVHYPDWRMLEEVDKGGPIQVIHTREPGGTGLGEKLRNLILLDYMDGFTEFCMLLAQRRHLRRELVEPSLVRGVSVISDRSDSSTWAFQIYGRERYELKNLFRDTMKFLDPLPDLYIFLDLPVEVARERLLFRQTRGGNMDRIDSESLDFHARAREGFLSFKAEVGVPCVYIDASRKPEAVAADVIAEISQFLRVGLL